MTSSEDRPPEPGQLEPDLARYSRQVLFEKIGIEGQRRLVASRVVLFGCGALGTVLANTLVRAGVGNLRICDRDYIERDNLQRQILFDESDIAANLPKSEAAARKLAIINPDVSVEPVVVDVNYTNIESLAQDAQLLLDGTDNFETRYLINDLAVKTNRPWIYGAVIGASGLVMTIIPHDTPCLRCVFEEAPPPEMNPTCDTAGVLAPAVNIVAGMQAIEAIKLLTGRSAEINRHLLSVDAWAGRVTRLNTRSVRETSDCPCCKAGKFPFLSGQRGSSATGLCGRNAVQVTTGSGGRTDFAAISRKLERVAAGPVRHNQFMLQARVDEYELTLFPDGRAIIKGTDDVDKARTFYAKYLGA